MYGICDILPASQVRLLEGENNNNGDSGDTLFKKMGYSWYIHGRIMGREQRYIMGTSGWCLI